MLSTHQQNSKIKLITTVVAVLVIAGTVVFADHLKAENTRLSTATVTVSQPITTTTTTPVTPTTTTPPATQPTNSSGYKDGTYTASGNYYVPRGTEQIKVTLTLKDGVIASSSLQNSEGDSDSAQYQEDFTSVYKSYVVGKKVSGLRLGVVAGASDTTQAFNDAVSQIASKAQA